MDADIDTIRLREVKAGARARTKPKPMDDYTRKLLDVVGRAMAVQRRQFEARLVEVREEIEDRIRRGFVGHFQQEGLRILDGIAREVNGQQLQTMARAFRDEIAGVASELADVIRSRPDVIVSSSERYEV